MEWTLDPPLWTLWVHWDKLDRLWVYWDMIEAHYGHYGAMGPLGQAMPTMDSMCPSGANFRCDFLGKIVRYRTRDFNKRCGTGAVKMDRA